MGELKGTVFQLGRHFVMCFLQVCGELTEGWSGDIMAVDIDSLVKAHFCKVPAGPTLEFVMLHFDQYML